ncbi:hypothetical protein FVEN_g5987 [Fusarium venenatum]|uniref:Extracellular membrane protein CFEM domain-containing protein n=1 Tax=Fusarium venenatum TaxID=56646 RepID=A0A2L2SUV2_9HYPO|nr:uncharacterized protein FVRRES_05728 [Fusarium venenatum]KAG8356288.1 hypothetical protein FVEN_g5987 [Fusarium venenatum]KAH6992780.1 hypothetical protein EDB82DRAFT_574458 [Fusarium venenatum]CEI61292.1 unnamed protein product [Fusarium venenatum]
MTRLLNALVLLGMAGSFVAGQAYDQEKQNKDATCNNNCFFKYFTNKCNEDNKACVCTLNDMREKFFCCIAENCADNVLPEQIERSSDGCVAWNLPFTFDAEAACGIKLPASSDTSSEATSTTTVARVKTSDAVTTTATGTEAETTASATETSTADQTTAASEPTTVENGASNLKAIGGAIALPVLLGLL